MRAQQAEGRSLSSSVTFPSVDIESPGTVCRLLTFLCRDTFRGFLHFENTVKEIDMGWDCLKINYKRTESFRDNLLYVFNVGI
jgi:hypothetical protein